MWTRVVVVRLVNVAIVAARVGTGLQYTSSVRRQKVEENEYGILWKEGGSELDYKRGNGVAMVTNKIGSCGGWWVRPCFVGNIKGKKEKEQKYSESPENMVKFTERCRRIVLVRIAQGTAM
uniref:Uncharacterized protein n=1 Tax=Rhodnius prolixus TaxID=13249 RepID=T1HIW0_RHOPR